MTSLIGGAVYLGYKKAVEHKQNKQKKKNYERWEGLRDELDEERRLSLDDRAAIFQRKERNSVDMPQRSSFDSHHKHVERPSERPGEILSERSTPAPLAPQPTSGRTRAVAWDDDIPAYLTVGRRDFSASPNPSSYQSDVSRTRTQSEDRRTPKDQEGRRSTSLERNNAAEEWSRPGGRMAELIETANEPHRPAQETSSYSWLDG